MKRNRSSIKTERLLPVGEIEKLEQIRANYCGKEVDEALDLLTKEINSNNIKSTDKAKYYCELFFEDIQRPLDQRMYVPKTIPQLTIDPAMIDKAYTTRMNGETFDEMELEDFFELTVQENPKEFGFDSIDLQKKRFLSYMKGMYLDYRYNIYQTIKYDAAYKQQAEDFLHKLFDFYKPSFVTVNEVCYYSYDLFAAIIKHSIWCVKNKLSKGKCAYPIFVSFEGDQGCGKSEFTRHLGRDVLGKLYAEVKTDQLNDNFAQGLWNKKIFCNFEDMDKEDTVGNGRIKRIITQDDILHRGMHSEEFHETANKATFFGNSNYAIWEIFPDKTGMRRYADLKFTRDDMKNDLVAQMYCDKIWKENCLALWKGVNEDEKMGYVFGNAMADLLDLARTTYISSNDTVKKWLEKNDLKVVSSRCNGGKTVKDAYEDYVSFTDEKLTCSYPNFCKRVQSLYTGKNKLKPSKLKIVNNIIAENDTTVQTEELNPFSQYIEFVPFEPNEPWRQNVPHVPGVPPKNEHLDDEKNFAQNKQNDREHGEHGEH